ncbi:MAG: 50S ribosomal protein L5 [Endomicrobium sp.]|nr:50S ribosomal protein L5 [Endomicrobium sp.]
MNARLKDYYKKFVVIKLQEHFHFININQVPKLTKIVINIGVGDAKDDVKVLNIASLELASITGQKPLICHAKKSISSFKLREGMPIGLKVTLRNRLMYEFLDKFINIAIPRIRDFRGIKVSNFDKYGNLNIGLSEQYIFPEVDIEKSDRSRGMNISIVTTATNNTQAKVLLELLGVPFKK